ncbi:hypothetical protein BJ165DRAFT_1359234, partial [Panaeolus papilionaceus]
KLADWLHARDEFLDIILQHEGISNNLSCSTCGMSPIVSPPNHHDSDQSRIRCLDCFNTSQLLCKSCCLAQHEHLPFHRIETWNGEFFVKSCLSELGLVRQLGHDGCDCPTQPDKASDNEIQELQVIHTTGVFKLSVRYCGCKPKTGTAPRYRQLLQERLFPATLRRIRTVFTFEVLETFHSLNLTGKMTSYDYYQHIMGRTDFLELKGLPSQLNNFNRVIRIWRHMLSLKRSGRAHSDSGASGTELGETLVECPVCPHPEKNTKLDKDEANAFLDTLFVAIDANFKLKQKDRGIEDIELGSGWGAFVEHEPYISHVTQKVDEPEINTCNSEHDAIVRSATRSTPGYSVSGVGLVICSCHCLIRRNGAGDLQKGEKYSNMDYILFSSLSGMKLQRVVITYDIACQWSRRLKTRMQDLPDRLHIPDHVDVRVAVPSWHINGHGKTCQERYNVSYMPEVGRLCGDEIEQTWWTTNGLGVSIREMSPAGRHEVVNDHWNYFNMRKIIGFRLRFSRKLKEAVEMSELHQENFEMFSATFNDEAVMQWEEMTLAWEKDQMKPNPYEEKDSGLTLQDVRFQLATEEEAAARSGEASVHKVSLSDFLLTGLEIEEQQRILVDDLLENAKPTTREATFFQQKQTTLLRRLNSWRDVQKSYMPCVSALLESEYGSELPPVESTKLFLPSALPDEFRLTVNRLASIECRARLAQAEVALEDVRCLLRAKSNLTTFKKLNLAGEGNKANTRARVLYDRLSKKVDNAAARYRTARSALGVLDPNGEWSIRLLELHDDQLRPLGKGAEDMSSVANKNRKDKTHHLIPWIWLVISPNTKKLDDEAELDVTARVQWAKSRAHALRWKEEVLLVVEEMRRCVAYLEWKVRWWEQRAQSRTGITAHLGAGLRAYALKQADYTRCLAGSSAVQWGPLLRALGFDNEWCMKYIPFTSPPPTCSQKSAQPAPHGTSESPDCTEELVELNSGSDAEESSSESESSEGGPPSDIDSDEDEDLQ